MISKKNLFIPLLFFIQSCNVGTSSIGVSSIWKNDHISNEKRNQITELNDKLFKAISNNDLIAFKSILSDSLIQQIGDLKKFVDGLSTSFKATSYRVLDEYYFHNSTTGIFDVIPPDKADDNNYKASFLAINKEMYLSLLIANRLNNEVLIFAVYGKYNNDWKLNILKIGQYSLFQKTAPSYYKMAKEFYNKSYLIDAYLNAELSDKLLRPADDLFIYQKEKEIKKFYDKVRSDLNTNFTLPLTLNKISTKPKIFRVYPEMGDDGFYPMILYLTDISLKDTTALKKENVNIQKEVKYQFKGIEQNKKYISFQAFNKLPEGQESIDHYGFIEHLKN